MSDEQTDFIDELEPLNIEARYPLLQGAVDEKSDR